VSKERARRRAEREALAERQRAERAAARRRADARTAAFDTVRAPVDRGRSGVRRWWRRRYPPGDPLARRRRRHALVLVGIVLVVAVLDLWLVPSWTGRLVVLALTLFLLPVVRVLIFDRR
jgi:Flp pilus assembly protein TadB